MKAPSSQARSAYIQNKTQAIFMLAAAGCFVAMLPLLFIGLKLQKLAQQENKYWPSFGELWPALVFYLLIYGIRSRFMRYMAPILQIRMQDKFTQKEKKERSLKAAEFAFMILFFSLSSYLGYSVLKNEVYLPPSLLGSGDTLRIFEGHPFTPIPSDLRYFYLFSLGFAIDAIIFHLASPPKKDFGQMFLHHFVTLQLLVFSYISNYVRIGALILFEQNIAEIPTNISRILVNLKDSKLGLTVSTAAMMIVWFYTRCYVFPYEIIYRGIYIGAYSWFPQEYYIAIWVYMGLLLLLAILQYYWFFIMLKMILHLCFKGEAVDLSIQDAKVK